MIKYEYYSVTNYIFNILFIRVQIIQMIHMQYSYTIRVYDILNLDEQRQRIVRM